MSDMDPAFLAIDEMAAGMGPVLRSVIAERIRQDAQWGGPKHDDQHPIEDWLLFIEKQLLAAEELVGIAEDDERIPTGSTADAEFRARLVKVAALAFAAIARLDRYTEGSR